MKKVILSLSLLCSTMFYAGGFRVSTQGVKQFAMAHTSAHAEDASVAFFNPAGISFIPAKFSVAAGGFGALSTINYQNLATLENVETNNPISTPVYAALAYKVTPNISVGFSFATPFGSTIQYPEDWSGRDIVQKMQLRSMFYQPMVSVKLAPWVALGASYIYATGSVNWDKAITQQGGSVNIKDEKAKGQGMAFGLYFQPDEKWDVTVAYRSPIRMEANNGVATFNLPQSVLSNLGLTSTNQDGFKATLPLVDEITLGATYKVLPNWKISAEMNYAGWENYNKLDLDFSKALVGNQPSDRTLQRTPKNFNNAKIFRVGTEYAFNPKIAGRLGYYYDESPYADQWFTPETPSFNSNVFTAGLGLKFGGLGIDLAGALALPKSRTFLNEYYNFGGQAKARAYYIGLGVYYNIK